METITGKAFTLYAALGAAPLLGLQVGRHFPARHARMRVVKRDRAKEGLRINTTEITASKTAPNPLP